MISLFTGPNSFGVTEAIKKRAAAFAGTVENFDGLELELSSLPDIFMGASLFSSNRLIVLRGLSANKTLWLDLEPWISRVPAESEIIIVEPAPDKRTKTYKQLVKYATVTEYADLREPELVSWLTSELKAQSVALSPELIRYLVSYVGRDQWRIRNEVAKLALVGEPITKEIIQDIVEPYPEATVFELLDAVFAGRSDDALRRITLLRDREDPYQFFGLLSSQVMGVFALVSAHGQRPEQIAKDMGLHPFVLKKLQPAAQRFGAARIERMIEQLAHADERIKTSGVEPWRQLEMTLLSIAVSSHH